MNKEYMEKILNEGTGKTVEDILTALRADEKRLKEQIDAINSTVSSNLFDINNEPFKGLVKLRNALQEDLNNIREAISSWENYDNID